MSDLVPLDGRWTCPQCSRFVAESAITYWDERDPGAYYGVATRYTVDCRTCGHLTDSDVLPPRWTPTRWGYPLTPADPHPHAWADLGTPGLHGSVCRLCGETQID